MLSQAALTEDMQFGLSGEQVPAREAAGDGPAVDDGPDARNLVVLYATETGASEEIARAFLDKALAAGLPARCADLADYDAEALGDEEDLVFVVSTTGEGEFPYAAAHFLEYVDADPAPRLHHIRYSVLALGDSSYQQFCCAGKQLDAALARSGASQITPRIDCDIDFEEPAETWQTQVLASLAGAPVAAEADNVRTTQEACDIIATHDASAHHELVPATVLDNSLLVGVGSTKATRHIALALDEGTAEYMPGDSLGLIARNDATVVNRLLEALGYPRDMPVELSTGRMSVADALAGYFEITTIAPRFLEGWAKLGGFAALASLLHEENSKSRANFVYENHIIDLVRRYPIAGLKPGPFLQLLRPLQPRSYSIASSLAATPNQVHLTVAPVEYQLHDEPRFGVATRYLSDIAAVGTKVHIYFQQNPHFRLPPSEMPIVMVGPGTGVAPFRSFLQERASATTRGPAWLFFGERNSATDFLYKSELNAFLDDGTLTHLDAVFSRDSQMQAGGEKYVQHRMRARSAELFEWIQRGAHFYVCGDATRMAKDVHQALIDVITEGLGGDRKGAESYLNSMRKAGRYQRDVY